MGAVALQGSFTEISYPALVEIDEADGGCILRVSGLTLAFNDARDPGSSRYGKSWMSVSPACRARPFGARTT